MGLGNGAVRPQVADEANTRIETPSTGLAPVGWGGVGCALSSGFPCPAFLLCRVRTSRFWVLGSFTDESSPVSPVGNWELPVVGVNN